MTEPQMDTDTIEEVEDSVYDDETMDDGVPTDEIAFLEQFYKGNVGSAEYIEENVTSNVLIKLKQDYAYDCPSNDCLAIWVFTAYPPGSDLKLEEGPIISETFTRGRYRVDFKYAFYHGTQQEFEIRTVYFVVSEIDGRYMISDYEVDNSSVEGTVPSSEEEHSLDEKIMMTGNVSKYGIHMVLAINGENVIGYYYYDSQGNNNRVTLKGTFTDQTLKLNKIDKDGNETGYFEGVFDGTSYQGENVNYNRDEALPFSVKVAN